MEAYEILLMPDGVDPSVETLHRRELFQTMMMRFADLGNNFHADIVSRIHTELMMGRIIYPSIYEHSNEIYTIMFEYYDEMDSKTKRNLFTCLREIAGLFGHELTEDGDCISRVLEDYLKMKKDIDNVSPEVSEEVEKMANMTDEEFKEKMENDDEEDTDNVSIPPINTFEPVQTSEFQPLTDHVHVDNDPPAKTSLSDEELKAIAPDTSKYNPEYDIPDEKLYDK